MNGASTATDRAIDGAALQIAIWDVVHDGGDGLSAGRIRSASNQNSNSTAAYTLATTWISESTGHAVNNVTIMINTAGTSQMQTLISYDGVLTPEPGTILCGAGLAAIVLFRRRLKR